MPETKPRIVAGMAAKLHRDTGHKPEVVMLPGKLWRLTLENDQVRLTINYRSRKPGGSTRWAGSTLTVDGESRPLAENYDHFVEIFRNPGMKGELAPIPPGGDITEAPAVVRAFYERNQRAGIYELRAGCDGDRWVIGLDHPRGGFRFTFRRGLDGKWRVDPAAPMQVIVDGADRTAETAGDLEKAFALLGGHLGEDGAPAGGPVAAAQASSRANSVEVRRATVIRN